MRCFERAGATPELRAMAVVLTAVALLAVWAPAPAHAAPPTASTTDPIDDTIDFFEWMDDNTVAVPGVPAGDLTSARVDYRADAHLAFQLTTRSAPSNANWQLVWWDIDVDDDGEPDFEVWADRDVEYPPEWEVVRLSDEVTRCRGTATSVFTLRIPSRCLGSPARFHTDAWYVYDSNAKDPDAPVTLDFAPDDDYLPAVTRPAFTTTLAIAAPSTVISGGSASITGTLKDGGGTGAAGVTVTLYRRPPGGTWAKVEAKPTSSTGVVTFTQHPTATTEYELRTTATSRYAATTSSRTTVTVPAVATTMKITASGTVGFGTPASVKGVLTTAAGRAAPGVNVTLQRRPPGTATWTKVSTRATDSAGAVAFSDRPSKSMEYRLVSTATPAYLATKTAPKVVTVAANAVRISRVQYDSPGRDDRSAASLNAEWVRLTNRGTRAQTLTGWTLRDVAGHTYTFGKLTLAAGSSVTVRTGRGTNTSTNLYWGSGNYIWNNDGDTATLRAWNGTTLSSCRWTKVGTGVTSC